ncbi:MAG: pantoate--beta-alanine ligase [Rikenellaceae bacterium]
MKIVNSVADLDSALCSAKAQGAGIVGLVPTMGALHEGHISLVDLARGECDCVVVSLFVNPTQFNDPKDLEKYPRTLEADARLLAAAGVDVLFAPEVADIYPEDGSYQRVEYDFGALERVMEGVHRPGHFAGVAEVVGRLFDLTTPDRAYFGEKDFQQLAIIRELERMRGSKIEIVGCPIVRAKSGLALSSRNMLLSPQGRESAAHIYSVIARAAQMVESAEQIEEWTTQQIEQNEDLRVEYVEVVDAQTLQKVDKNTTNRHLCVVVHCQGVRLIDNIAIVR